MSQKIRSRFVFLVLFTLLLQACGGGSTASTSGGGAAAGANGEAYVPLANIETVELLTPTSGVGIKPLFEWSPVQGAVNYSLYLQFPNGQPYWAWSGSVTSIYLGGTDSQPPDDAAGPILQKGMSWSVIAFDAENNIIASSVVQEISP